MSLTVARSLRRRTSAAARRSANSVSGAGGRKATLSRNDGARPARAARWLPSPIRTKRMSRRFFALAEPRRLRCPDPACCPCFRYASRREHRRAIHAGVGRDGGPAAPFRSIDQLAKAGMRAGGTPSDSIGGRKLSDTMPTPAAPDSAFFSIDAVIPATAPPPAIPLWPAAFANEAPIITIRGHLSRWARRQPANAPHLGAGGHADDEDPARQPISSSSLVEGNLPRRGLSISRFASLERSAAAVLLRFCRALTSGAH